MHSRESDVFFFFFIKIPKENPACYFVLTGSNSSHESWVPKFWPEPLKKIF